jgi:ABC-type uncharacterized transport system permease subunit
MIVAINPLFTVMTLVSAVAYAGVAWGHRALSARQSRWMFGLAWATHGLALVAYVMQRPLMFGFAFAVSAMAWVVSSVYGVETQLYPRLRTRWALAALGSFSVLLAWWFPGTHHPSLVSPWLTVHWVLGFASYGLFAVAVFHAWLLQRAEADMRLATPASDLPPLLKLERLTFRFVGVAYALLSATLLGGVVFSEALFGVAWRWDHKTVFALLAWLTVTLLLLGRWRWGWRGKQAARVLYVGAGFLLLSYVGSRFVMDMVLHRS